jgi:hypothetical protein
MLPFGSKVTGGLVGQTGMDELIAWRDPAGRDLLA